MTKTFSINGAPVRFLFWLCLAFAFCGCRGSGPHVAGPNGMTGTGAGPDGGGAPAGLSASANGCASSVAAGNEPVIDDFESTTPALPTNDGRTGAWFFYDDGTGGQQDVEFDRSASALHVVSDGFSGWGSGLGVTLAPGSTPARACPYDASAYTGLSFRARGSGRIRVRVATPETTPKADGGECTLAGEDCYDWPGAWVALGPDFEVYSFPFCALKPEGWSGASNELDPSRISAIHFMLEGSAELWLDELAFGTTANTDPGSCAGPCPLDAAPAVSVTPETTWLALSDSLSLHTFEQTTVRCGAIQRRYLSYVPERLGEGSDAPVVFAFHGSGANAESFQETQARGGLDALAERDGFIVVYGNAAPGAYSQADVPNSGSWREDYFDDGQVDDVAYLKLVLHDLEQRRVVSGSNPLFLIGVSNGGGMVLEAAKQWPERVTGIAPFMAFDGFEPSPIPDLGDSPLERVFFGYAPGDPGLPQGYVDDVLSKLPIDWAKALGLSDAIIAAPAVEQLPDRVEEGAGYTGSAEAALATRDSRATRYDYGGPSDGRRVRLLVFENAGHFWPNPVQDSEDWILQRWGFRNQDVDASAEVWDFFRDALEAP